MRRFGFVFTTVTIVVGLGLVLLYNGGLRGWTTLRDPRTPQRIAPSSAPCCRIRIESSYRDLVRLTKLPFSVRLRPDSAYTWAKRVWYAGDFIPADSSAPAVRWAPFSADSLDLQIETFPIAVRLRFARHGRDSTARSELWDDTGAITLLKRPAFVIHRECGDLSSGSGNSKVNSR